MIVKWSLTSEVKLNGLKNLPGFWLPSLARVIIEKANEGVLFNDLNACNNFVLDNKNLVKLNLPVTIISGGQDLMTPAKYGLELSRIFPNSKFFNIETSGHMMMLEAPNKVNNILKNCLGL